MNEVTSTEDQVSARKWQPLDALQRRVLGVLVEKAKTTPDSYPLTVNSIKSACNQKSNRHPQMDLDEDDVIATLDELREMGAVAEIQGDGRVSKYRHLAYDWLGVDKVELAVMAELMLRGDQTVGELRGRAARMEPISGLTELKPVLSRLKDKGLLVEVTPPGRGQIVTHGLFPANERTVAAAAEPRLTSGVSHSSTPLPSASDSATAAGSSSPVSSTPSLEQRLEMLERRVAELERHIGSG
jgi:uncharacterized protein YceH (UPF0502 family)